MSSTPSKISTLLAMLAAAVGAFFRHLTTGPPAPTWPIFLSVLMAVIRAQSGSLARARKAHPPSSPEEVVRLVKEERDEVEKLTTIPADKLADGVVKEITFEVRKRGLGGVLAELDAEETGKRTLTAEWLAHVKMVESPRLARSEKVVLAIHGGAHVRFSPHTHRDLHVALSDATRCHVFSLAYRLSPEVRYPASLLDTVHAYLHLTEELDIPAENILVEGDSAGANIVIALLMYLRDVGLPQVGGAILLSPWVDLSTSFTSWDENKPHDYIAIDDPSDPLHPPRLYLSSGLAHLEHTHHLSQLADPYISPALAPLPALAHLPPLLVHSGALETLRDEHAVFVRRARRAGTDVAHQLWTDGVHVFHALQPETAGASAMAEVGEWVQARFATPVRSSAGAGAGSGSISISPPPWAQRIRALLADERAARIARAGPIKSARGPSVKWAYERTVERLGRVGVKEGAIEEAIAAASEADEVEDEEALTEVFRPRRVGDAGWFGRGRRGAASGADEP